MNLKTKKVLVTGACGFIGSHLVERLLEESAFVRAFVYYNSFNNWGWLDTLPIEKRRACQVFSGDIRDPNGVRKAVENIDIVFHLAALIGIPFSYHSPSSYVDTNINGTLNVLQACRDCSIDRLLVTSTSEVYGTALSVPIDENHPRQGQSPYSATKIGADFLAESYWRSFDLPVVTVRPFNTYGPRQSARAVIPAIIIQLLAGKDSIRLGSRNPTRDFVFVRDTVEGFLALAQADDRVLGEAVNIATKSEVSIGDLADRLISMINPTTKIVSDELRLRPVKSEVERLLGDNRKIRSFTSWEPHYSLEDGLAETIAWFRQPENLVGYKHDLYNI
jgi:NAD dependent epimerase/dehydratase